MLADWIIGMSSLLVTDTTWGMMGRVRKSMEPRLVSSVANCSPLTQLLIWAGLGDCERKTNLFSDEMLHGLHE